MAFKRDRVKPTAYPFLPFHLIRSAQLVSSLIVGSIMAYFMRELSANNYSLPWTFILLLTVSLLTVASLTLTIVLHVRHGLNPHFNLALNGSLAVFWAVSFALLAWWSSSTLTSACAVENWESELGMGVCRTYKALFSFALLGLVATLVALGLDIHVQRSSTRKGRFMSLGMMDGKGGSAGAERLDVDDGIWDTNPNPAALRESTQRGGDGYVVPEEQFGYADTSYAGAAGQMGRRSVEERL